MVSCIRSLNPNNITTRIIRDDQGIIGRKRMRKRSKNPSHSRCIIRTQETTGKIRATNASRKGIMRVH
jgi:hypothetical protein